MNRQRLLEEFNSFTKEAVAGQASAQQRRDLRRAFMVGAASMYKITLQGLLSTNVIMPDDIQRIKDLQEEMQAYGKAVNEGRE